MRGLVGGGFAGGGAQESFACGPVPNRRSRTPELQRTLGAFHLVGDFLQERCPWAAPDAAVAMATSTSAIGPGRPHYVAP